MTELGSLNVCDIVFNRLFIPHSAGPALNDDTSKKAGKSINLKL